jgi:two-component system phosphate regulon response regulator PhoB
MDRKQTILVVEDDEDLRRLFRTALTIAGYTVEEAGDGLEALHKIDQAPPDLVVLDLMLPHVSGVAVRQEIAAHVLTRQIPVVITTGLTLDVGAIEADCVLRKPVSPDRLLAAVQDCLGRGTSGAKS